MSEISKLYTTKEIKNADVIIVGTGIAASMMAKQLSNYKLDNGKFIPIDFSKADQHNSDNAIKIVMLEAGLEQGLYLNSYI